MSIEVVSPAGDKTDEAAVYALERALEEFDREGLRYCLSHRSVQAAGGTSDVDIIIDGTVSPRRLYSVLHRAHARIGADLARCRGYLIQLAGNRPDGSTFFLTLDLTREAGTNELRFYRGEEMLASRRKVGGLWVPSAPMEFTNHLARCVAKLRLDGARGEVLVRLFQEDPAGCAAEAERFWTGPHASLLVEAARSGNWSAVRTDLIALRAELVRKARRSPVALLRAALVRFLDRANRFVRPEGMSVVVLGPDGAGKSSVTTALETVRLPPVFDRSVCWGFVPPLHRLIGRNLGPSSEPHSLPARSPLNSALRATYWFLYSTVGYARVHLALARSSLVLYDRHLVDILVDPKRYRYAGPMWPMRLMWRIIPKPDLVILLDAPAEIIQARKQEVPFAETVRQREEYLELVQGLRNGRVIDASRSFDEVTNRATEIILDFLSARTARRLRLHNEESARPARDRSSELRTLSQ